MASSEQYGFVFAVTFIVIFSTLLSTIPIDFQGSAETPDMIVPIDPSLLTGFSATENYTRSALSGAPFSHYDYTLGGFTWTFQLVDDLTIALGAQVWIGGVLFLGQLDSSKFISLDGDDRGGYLTTSEITTDADDGVAKYSLVSIGGGQSQGSLIFYWNTTTYSNATDAWDSYELYILHGMGFAESATSNIGALLVSLLLLQVPEVPLLVNILLVTPLWACIVFVLWFIIKEMIPFV